MTNGSIQLPEGVSFTALQTLAVRAAESARSDALFRDPFAERLLALIEDEQGGVVDAQGKRGSLRFSNDLAWLFGDYHAIRTHYLDQRLQAAVETGLTQIVSLAAGMDGRAYRLPWPEGTRLFEVDKPELLAFKQVLADKAKLPCPVELAGVPADLRDDWITPLSAAGFTGERPTAWLVEGILQYFSPAEADTLLAKLSRASAPGSRLLTVYGVGDYFRPARLAGRDAASDMDAVNRMTQTGPLLPPEEWLPQHGWEPRTTTVAAWAERLGRPVPPGMNPNGGGAAFYLVDALRS